MTTGPALWSLGELPMKLARVDVVATPNQRTRLAAMETKAVLLYVEDAPRVSDVGAVEFARIVSRPSRQLLRAPVSIQETLLSQVEAVAA